jgi:predicted Zn-dependent peptidase
MTEASAPPVLPTVGWRFPAGQESVLDNGIRVLSYHCPGQYVASAALLFDVPLNVEPLDIEGVAGLAARTLTRGAGEMSADEFSDALAASGAELDASASPDGFSVRLSVPLSRLTRGLQLMAQAVTEPAYRSREFEQEQRLRLQEIEHAMAYPGAVTVERLHQAIFGEARAARPAGGTAETVAAITLDDVTAFANAHLQPSTATLILAGDFTGQDAAALADAALGDWRHTGEERVAPERPQVAGVPRIVVVDWPDAPQATVRVAGPGITRGDGRWPPMFVANYAVGGSFGSRLNSVLREQKGLTYGIGSTLDAGRRVGVLGVGASIRIDATAEAIGDILSILDAARGSLTDDEVATGVRATADSAALSFERAEAVVARVEVLVSHGLPLDHVDANLARIRQVTTESANAAYAELVRPDMFTIVVAGEADVVAEPLERLGYAPVEVVARP